MRRRVLPAGATAIVAIAVFALLSRRQVAVWRDDLTLYRHALEHTEGNYVALANYGGALLRGGRAAAAIDAFGAASRLRPREWRPHLGRADALASLGRLEEAAVELRTALALNPAAFEGRNYLGLVLLRQGRPEEARREFLSALELKSDYADPMNNLGTIELDAGRPAAAARWFTSALAARPGFPEAARNLERARRLGGGMPAPAR